VEAQKVSQNPVNIGEKRCILCVFTPDSGPTNLPFQPPLPVGDLGAGTVFSLTTNGVLTTLYTFNGSNDGANPSALTLGSDGNFYGATFRGGNGTAQYSLGFGTIFKITTNGILTTLYSFTNGSDGAIPNALTQGGDGDFYGTTLEGGATNAQYPDGFGTVFKISTNGALTALYSFTGLMDGSTPVAGLVLGSDGDFYGTTDTGGSSTYNSATGGTIFKITPKGVLTTLFAFDNADGFNPQAPLVQASDGNFYGTAYSSETGSGTVFSMTPGGALTTIYAFGDAYNNSEGGYPCAGLMQASDGNLYGSTSQFGSLGGGTLLRVILPLKVVSATVAAGVCQLTWNTACGCSYQIQYSSSATSGSWTNLGAPMCASGLTLSATDSMTTNAQKFYRVVQIP
jgi:uncharacterized repeat protein (TIGR03803 family)